MFCNKIIQYITVISVLVLFVCCENDKTINEQYRDHEKSIVQNDTAINIEKNNKKCNITPTVFYIKDSSKYSNSFLKEFKEKHLAYHTVSLIDDTIIINNHRESIIKIPTDLPMNSDVIYKTKYNNKIYNLIITRINYSTITYDYFEIEHEKKINERQGFANIEPVFYFGAEGTFEDKDGKVYGMNEYIDHSEKDCWTYIYIGMGNINKSFLTHGCESNKEMVKTPELLKIK